MTLPDRDGARTRLVVATTAHFAWAKAGGPGPSADGLVLPPGGLDSPEVLGWVERSAREVSRGLGRPSAWLIASGMDAVGLISFKALPRERAIEIGYGVAERHRGLGHASRAVALVLDEARALGLDVTAETTAENLASQRVLARNGFERCGERVDVDERLLAWRWLGGRQLVH